MVALYIVTVFLSASLLFMVQPMAAKAILPLLGGSPAVWNTVMVFFQAALLAGYAYSHGLSRRLSMRAQVAAHVVLLSGAALLLPAVLPAGASPPADAGPTRWVLGLLLVMVGGPFVAVSTTGPLLQRWFSFTGHARSHDPYFLYAASNAGSLLGLLAYPVVVEPMLNLREQAWAWAGGYLALIVLVALCGVWARARRAPAGGAESPRLASASSAGEPVVSAAGSPPARGRWCERALWVGLAFIPSALLLACTQHLTTDVASIPLLWVVPLTLYLLTFIIAFSGRFAGSLRAWSVAGALAAGAIVVMFIAPPTTALDLILGGHLAAQFLLTMVCHRRLVACRPAAGRLTEFYLALALGGVLGGAFEAPVAPAIFDRVIEYPLAIVGACLARAGWRRSRQSPGARLLSLALSTLPATVMLLVVALLGAVSDRSATVYYSEGARLAWGAGAGALLAVLLSGRRVPFAVSILLLLLVGELEKARTSDTRELRRDRTFFGVLVVEEDHGPNGREHRLMHGTTNHGYQIMEDAFRALPTTYYHRAGPVGDVMEAMRHRRTRVGVVGLGSGTIAAYARPGDAYTYFEIDPGVQRIAEDPRLFTYLPDARSRGASVEIILGDGRLTLAARPEGSFDLLIIDAFSSDAIPVHLLTREAVAMFLARLAPGGLVMIHVSNRHLELAPVVARIAESLGASCLRREDSGDDGVRYSSEWLVLGRGPDTLEPLALPQSWRPVPLEPGDPLWTDDRSDLLSVIRW